jgi:hypothetical protein
VSIQNFGAGLAEYARIVLGFPEQWELDMNWSGWSLCGGRFFEDGQILVKTRNIQYDWILGSQPPVWQGITSEIPYHVSPLWTDDQVFLPTVFWSIQAPSMSTEAGAKVWSVDNSQFRLVKEDAAQFEALS